jgi:parallel beta-helix repeat protein
VVSPVSAVTTRSYRRLSKPATKGIDMMPAKLRPRTAPTVLVSLATLVAFAATGAMALGGGPSSASHVSCGDTITADTTLDSDLTGCPSNGIVIGADDITLDLNGHAVAGNGRPVRRCPRREVCDVGVVNDGHDGITVRNGSVSGFASGVFVGRARNNRVLNVSSSRNQFFGFVIAESARSLVRGSSGDDNPEPDGDGIGIFASQHLRILNNSFRRNDLGMHVDQSTDITIEGNRFARNAHMGILMEADRNEVRGNHCKRNSECIVVAPGNRNVVAGNRSFRDNGGIAIEKGRGNLVARNVVLHARWEGIRLGINEPPIGGVANVARGNLVRGGRNGFLVAENDRDSVLRSNTAIAAADDGFDVKSSSAKLKANRALRNADLGIEGVPGVRDAGGNTARHNGDPRQCTHIRCR